MATKKKAATRKIETKPSKKPASKKPAATRRPGRPPGSTNTAAAVVDMVVSRCPKCGSTNRAPYWGKIERDCRISRGGVEYTHLVLRSTRCTDCGTIRRDRHFETRPTPVVDQVEAKRDQVDQVEPPTEKRPKGGRGRQLGHKRGAVG